MAKSNKHQEREAGLTKLLRRKAQRFLDQPGVTSVGVGYRVQDGKESNELCIQFTEFLQRTRGNRKGVSTFRTTGCTRLHCELVST